LAPAPAEIWNAQIEYRRGLRFSSLADGELRVGLGMDNAKGPVRNPVDVRGFVEWRQAL
jgi:hypothetical protein